MQGRWERERFTGVELYGKTLGTVGLGNIGSEVSRRAAALGMRVIAFDPYVSPDRASRVQAAFTGWAGNRTLARDGEHGLAFESLDTPGKRVCVLGDCEGWAD